MILRAARVAAAMALIAVATGCSGPMERATVSIGDQTFEVEVAESMLQQRAGLSGRESIPEGTGMLFEFGRPDIKSVWMKDTLVALDVAWIADDRVVAARTLQPCVDSDCPSWESPQRVDALLEVAAGSLAQVPAGSQVVVTRN